ncbi:unnamed protein product [Merluccius merluccius]
METLPLLWLLLHAGLRGQACLPGQWQCDDGNCISAGWRCDADADCLDGSDETNCQTCPAGQFACVDSAGCVPESGRCDGVRQCPTGSDEEDCATGDDGCLQADWRCLNAMCVPGEARCDGTGDCGDGSDERDCERCADGWVTCPEGGCVPPEQRCDGKPQCPDGSDEPLSCGRVCSVGNGGCSHVCADEPWGVLCDCPPGLKLSVNGAVCEDVDECGQPFPPCTQHCTNTVGSFYCHCRDGFLLDQSACLASGGAPRLLSVQKRSLVLVGLDSQPLETLWTADSDPLAVTFDLGRGWYYWADGQGSIYKTDGKKSDTVYAGQPGITSLACDWLNGYLYWTNQKTQSIYMGSPDGRGFTTLLSKSISPSEMVVLPVESLMFWINVGPGERRTLDWSWMDGTGRRTLVVLTTQAAHSLTLDVASRRLYWISHFKNSVETVRIDGTGRYSLPAGLLASRSTAALAVFANRIYWTDYRGLWQADQNQTNKKALIQKAVLPLMTVVHELQQPQGSSACTDSPCQLCLLTKLNPQGFTCSCPDNKILMPDRRCDCKFVYATAASINMVEFKEGEVIWTQLFTAEGILTYDVDWYRDGLYWVNRTGQIQHTSLTQHKTQPVPTLLPEPALGSTYDPVTPVVSGEVTGPPEPTPAPCISPAVQCPLSDLCITHTQLCDGQKDCPDGSDEGNCVKRCPNKNDFRCKDRRSCVSKSLVCDGRAHCHDGSDEVGCPAVAPAAPQTSSLRCRLGSRPCGDGQQCVLYSHVCDGEPDCGDGSDEQDCGEFQCAQGRRCLPRAQVCDGRPQCPDQSDESDCWKPSRSCQHRCDDNKRCLPATFLCDGEQDCRDGSDESGFSDAGPRPAGPLRCRKGWRPCRDGRACVLYSHVCDGEADCEDGSDEEDCRSQCKEEETQCAQGNRCVPLDQVCDGQYQCPDRSDEADCPVVMEGCQHRCDNGTRCVPDSFLCDGERDCADGSDETKCGLQPCRIAQFRCSSGQCVSDALRCDGYADCRDRSDEVGCARPPRCRQDLRCTHSHECLQKEWLCDGEKDCQDGSDEKNCTFAAVKCREFQWQCGGSSQCVPLTWRCDGAKDCHNGADEDQCGARSCPASTFQCGSSECLDPALVCNRITNCADGSDEGPGCLQQNCSGPAAPRCDHRCVSTPHGARCSCAAGFRLHTGGVSCVDEDECNQDEGRCKHSCVNTAGSYVCRCFPGFLLEPDMRSCKTKDEAMLLASVQSELLVVGLHSAQTTLLSRASRPVFSLDYHWQQQRVYWLSPDYQSVRWAHLSQPSTKGTLVKGVRSDFLALDWVGRNLYWVDGLLAQIVAVPLVDYLVRPQNYTVVLGEDLEQPSSLVLLPHRGLMVWSEIGSAPQIEQAGMDGSRRRVLVNRSLSWPVSLTFDLLGDRLYWVDEKLRSIGSASLDGDNLKILQLEETPSPFSVAVFNDKLFWSDTKRRTIRSADKRTGKDQKVLLKRPGQPFGLKVMHPLSQPAIPSPCDRTRCSHICLLGPGSRSGALAPRGPTAVCRCPPGLLLSRDRLACSPPAESAFILLLSQTSITQVFLRSLQNGVSLKKPPSGHRVLDIPGVSRASALDADIPTLSVYLADSGRGSLELLKLSTSRSKQALTPAATILRLQDDEVTGLAVDWVTSNVYWSSSNLPDLQVTSIHGAYTVSLLQGSLKGCTSLAVHPPSGRLCYTAVGGGEAGGAWRTSSQVDCAYMDGRKRVVLWRKGNIPASLVFDNDGKRIFWADLGEGLVASMAMDGTRYRAYKTGPGLLSVFTSVDNMLLWVTAHQGTSRVWVSDGVQPRQLWFQMRSSLLDLKAYSRSSQTGSNSCSNQNGGCAQLCLPHPDGRTCRCGRDFRIANVTSCVSPPPPCGPRGEPCSAGVPPLSGVGGAAVQKDLTSCGVTRCSGHGRCSGEGAACECNHGYSGESCQVESGGRHAPAVIATLCILTGLVAAAVVFKKRRAWRLVRRRSLEKETLMTNMDMPLPDGFYDSDMEDLDSRLDLDSPLDLDPAMELNASLAEPARVQNEQRPRTTL